MIKPFPDSIYSVTNILREKSFNNEFYKNEKIIEIEKTFEEFLENKTDIKHIRVLADPGTGKTKAVLEFCKAYNSNVLYVESAEKFDDSQLYSYLKKLNNTQITLIIDECNLNNAKTFIDRLTYKLKNLKLITIYNDFNTNTADTETKIIEYPKLTNEDFTKILTDNYGMRKADASHIASFCEGYPRLAHYIGHNFIANKKVLENLEDVMKGIVLSSITDENEQKNILSILRYLSVFKKFGCSEHNSDEKQCIFELIKYELPNLTKIDFDRIINFLKSQKILQQEYTLYISPKILHIWFFGEFWKNEARKNHLLVNVENMPERLQMWFSEMFTYARNAEISVDIPKELLSQFDLSALKSKKKSDFFVNLTKANQKEALNVLLKIFDNLPDEEIKNFTDTRMKPAIDSFSKIKNELEKTTPEDSIEAFFDINSWDVLENFDNHFEAFVNVILKVYNNFYESADEEKKQNFIKLCIQKKYKNDLYFGTAIAKADNLDFLPDDYITYVKNSDNEDGLFIPGYLNEMYKKSNENYDKAIQKIYDLELYELVFNINVQGYKTDLSTKLLLDVITTGKVQADKMQKLVWDIDRIPENIIKELLEFSLKGENHSAIKASLNILMHCKTLWKEENINLIYNILSKIVYKEQGKVYANISDDYIWANVISKFIKTCNNEEQIFNIFDKLLDYITSKSGYYLSNEIRKVFSLTAKRNSRRSWALISKYLVPDKIVFSPIREWLRGDDGFGHNVSGAMSEYNPDDIYKWIDENIDERLRIIARCCPKDLFIGGNVIKSLLIRYGSNENLYRYLHFNYASKGWIGKESDYIKNELALAEKTKDNEKNIYVLNFINQYIDNLNVDLNRAERYEERYN